MRIIKSLLRDLAHRHNIAVGLYRRLCKPMGEEWAQYVKKHGGLHSMGEKCSIGPEVVITDPAYTSLGSNVRLSGCTIFGHDGSINMLNEAYPGMSLDKVGPVVIGNNVFVGHGSIILPGTRIGNNVVIGAGTRVSGVVRDNVVLKPAAPVEVCGTDQLAIKIKRVSHKDPWHQLIVQRGATFDVRLQSKLDSIRTTHWVSRGILPAPPPPQASPHSQAASLPALAR